MLIYAIGMIRPLDAALRRVGSGIREFVDHLKGCVSNWRIGTRSTGRVNSSGELSVDAFRELSPTRCQYEPVRSPVKPSGAIF